MRMSTKGRYGLRVMLELAKHHGQGPVSVDLIAKNQGISQNYIHVLVQGLKAAGLVRTARGPGGGYELARPPSGVTALDVVRALEGDAELVECVQDVASCPRGETCVVRELWGEVGAAIKRVLGVTLEQLVERDRMRAEEVVTYFI